jgi:ribosome-associated protein
MRILAPTLEEFTHELVFTTSRSSGPGGQNVNKVNSKVTLRWDVSGSFISAEQKEIVLTKLQAYITKDGVLLLTAQDSRSQLENKEVVLMKLSQLLTKAFAQRKKRKPTKPGKAAKQVRLNQKKQHSEKKKWRQKPE